MTKPKKCTLKTASLERLAPHDNFPSTDLKSTAAASNTNRKTAFQAKLAARTHSNAPLQSSPSAISPTNKMPSPSLLTSASATPITIGRPNPAPIKLI